MQTTDDILFSAHGPDPIPSATTEIVGTPGNARNVYWIVSHFPIGSVVSGPFPQKDSPNVLDDENYVHISWRATLGALSYDLLFTRELQLPRQPGRFLLAANLTSTEFRDAGQDLDLYDLAGIRYGAPQQEWIYFDNRDRKQPTLRFIPWPIEVSSIIFEDGTSLSTAGAAGGAAPPDRSIQFNSNGAFSGSPDFTFDSNGNVLIGTPNVVNFPPPITGSRVLSLQGPAGATMEVSRSGTDAAGNVVGQFMWLDVNTTAPSNDIGVIRVLQEGTTLSNLGSQMEFYTKQDNAPGVSVPNPQMVINNLGYVGINTQNPQAQLEVAASGNGLRVRNFPGSSSNTEGVWISQFGGLRGFISGGTYGGYHELDIDGFPVLLCRQDQSGGNVGIGVLNPQSKLDVFDSINISATASSELPPTQPGPGNSWSLSFSNLNILATDQRVARISVNTESFIDSGVLMFQTANAGVMSEKMRITTSDVLLCPNGGFVGINNGAQLPFAPLDVLMSGIGHLLIRPGTSPTGTVVSIESVNPPNSSFAPLAITATAYIFGGLPGTNPGAGSKELWYDPADGNIVKYAP